MWPRDHVTAWSCDRARYGGLRSKALSCSRQGWLPRAGCRAMVTVLHKLDPPGTGPETCLLPHIRLIITHHQPYLPLSSERPPQFTHYLVGRIYVCVSVCERVSVCVCVCDSASLSSAHVCFYGVNILCQPPLTPRLCSWSPPPHPTQITSRNCRYTRVWLFWELSMHFDTFAFKVHKHREQVLG